jgi:AhpD family alkylhydroperoxidase
MFPVLFLVIASAGAQVAGGSAARAETSPADAARADIVKTLGFVPVYLKALPDAVLPGAWAEMKQFEDCETALPSKVKGLISLAVASQIPSRLAIYAYTRIARTSGAAEIEIKEAVSMAALSRHWSTFFNGAQLDEAKFRAELAQMTEYGQKMATGKAPPPRPMEVTDARSALADIKQSFGFVPEFVAKFPPEALAGAWLEIKTMEMGETTIPGKYKSLIGLAVSSQIPCKYCIAADTEFARLDGASDREIHEAVTIAAMARHMTTLVEGLQIDEKAARRDLDRVLAGMKANKMASR